MDEWTLRDYTKVLFRQKGVIFLCIAVVTLTVAVGLKLKTPVYAASVKMLISAQKQVESPYSTDLSHQNLQLALTQSEIVISLPVVQRVLAAISVYRSVKDYLTHEKNFAGPLKKKLIALNNKKLEANFEQLHFNPQQKQAYIYSLALAELRKSISVDPLRDTNIFTITVKDYDPVGAAVIANIVSRSYIIFDLQQQLADMQMKYGDKHLAVVQLRDSIEAMKKNLNGQTLDDIEAIGPASVKIIEQATPPLGPVGQPKSLIIALALVMSIFLGLMLAFIFEYLDQSFKSPQDIERALGVGFLGSIRRGAKFSAYKSAAEQLYLVLKDKGLKTVMFTATRSREGVTTVCTNVGRYIAHHLNHKVLVIHTNPRGMSLKKQKLDGPGLFDALEGRAEWKKLVKDIGPKLSVLSCGKTELNPSLLLESHAFAELLNQACGQFEFVFIDAASLQTSKDAVELAGMTDAAVLVIREGVARRQAVKQAVDPLKTKKAPLIGAFLNYRKHPIPKFLYERV